MRRVGIAELATVAAHALCGNGRRKTERKNRNKNVREMTNERTDAAGYILPRELENCDVRTVYILQWPAFYASSLCLSNLFFAAAVEKEPVFSGISDDVLK